MCQASFLLKSRQMLTLKAAASSIMRSKKRFQVESKMISCCRRCALHVNYNITYPRFCVKGKGTLARYIQYAFYICYHLI